MDWVPLIARMLDGEGAWRGVRLKGQGSSEGQDSEGGASIDRCSRPVSLGMILSMT